MTLFKHNTPRLTDSKSLETTSLSLRGVRIATGEPSGNAGRPKTIAAQKERLSLELSPEDDGFPHWAACRGED
jgi:hypothetical protein